MAYQSTDCDLSRANLSASYADIQASETRRGFLLQLFILVSTGSAITATACIVCLVTFMIISIPEGGNFSANSAIHLIIQLYQIVMFVIVILIEMESSEAIRTMSILQSWGIRGLSYIFVGLLTFQEAGGLVTLPCTARLPFLKVPFCSLIGFGIIYSIMVRHVKSYLSRSPITHQIETSTSKFI